MMMRFGLLFPEVSVEETRTAVVKAPWPDDLPDALPVDEYGFDEHYCADRTCDCRRVLLYVYARHASAHVATISHAFDPPGKNKLIREQTFLDPILPQSELAPMLLELFQREVLADQAYRQRLRTHYRMFKSVVNNPFHPAHRKLRA